MRTFTAVPGQTMFDKRHEYIKLLGDKVSDECYFTMLPHVCAGDFAIRPKSLPFRDEWIPVHVRLSNSEPRNGMYNFSNWAQTPQCAPCLYQSTLLEYGWIFDSKRFPANKGSINLKPGGRMDMAENRYTLELDDDLHIGKKLAGCFYEFDPKTMEELRKPPLELHQKSQSSAIMGMNFVRKAGFREVLGEWAINNVGHFDYEGKTMKVQHMIGNKCKSSKGRLSANYAKFATKVAKTLEFKKQKGFAPRYEEVADLLFVYLPTKHPEKDKWFYAVPKYELAEHEVLRTTTNKGKLHFSVEDPTNASNVASKWDWTKKYVINVEDDACKDILKKMVKDQDDYNTALLNDKSFDVK